MPMFWVFITYYARLTIQLDDGECVWWCLILTPIEIYHIMIYSIEMKYSISSYLSLVQQS